MITLELEIENARDAVEQACLNGQSSGTVAYLSERLHKLQMIKAKQDSAVFASHAFGQNPLTQQGLSNIPYTQYIGNKEPFPTTSAKGYPSDIPLTLCKRCEKSHSKNYMIGFQYKMATKVEIQTITLCYSCVQTLLEKLLYKNIIPLELLLDFQDGLIE
jgi:hypothetical protein